MEGSNVALLCDFRGYEYPYPPKWFYQNRNGKYHQLNFAQKSFKNDEKLDEIVKISEQPTKGLAQILRYDKIRLLLFRFLFCFI